VSRKLYLFEWNEDSARARAELLSIDGWEVETESANVARGVKRVADWMPDVVVLDLFLKASWSWEAVSALQARSRTRDIPIVLVDGSAGMVEKIVAHTTSSAIATSSFDLSTALEALVPKDE